MVDPEPMELLVDPVLTVPLVFLEQLVQVGYHLLLELLD